MHFCKEIAADCTSYILAVAGHNNAELKYKEGTKMNTNANKCIECTVKSCAYHCDTENFCSLDRILVGTHESNPAMDQCTDCKSFRKK
jgi:hypothetical protein